MRGKEATLQSHRIWTKFIDSVTIDVAIYSDSERELPLASLQNTVDRMPPPRMRTAKVAR
jgi:hypothetical protein